MSTYNQLSEKERYCITAGLKSGHSVLTIAKTLDRHPSTIYRELGRNRTHHDGDYRSLIAHSYATARRRRERRGSQFTQDQWDIVINLIRRNYSPEQISGILEREKNFKISHETIYKYIIQDKRRGGDLHEHLRIKTRRHRKRTGSHQKRGILLDKRHISTRPISAEKRSWIGHWEGDTVIGADRHHCIVTLVERKTGFAIIKKVQAKTSCEINRVCIEAIQKYLWRFRTITFDNGTEFHGYKEIEEKVQIKCYFATPYHSWERGSNENLNGLIRQYIPKGSCMRKITQVDCDWIADELNSRPRKRHGYRSPKELFYAY